MKQLVENQLLLEHEQKWNEWFAGLVDGDGCLLLSKKGYMSLEITMSIYDERTLLRIKQVLQGSVKLKSKAFAFRYRLHHKEGMIRALNKLNGLCRNTKRTAQLKKLCQKANIAYKNPKVLTKKSAWFSGFFDADGSISYSFKNTWPQLEISVSNKKLIDCECFYAFFNGRLYLDKRSNTHKWVISSKEDILVFYSYLQNYPLRSFKQKRVLLIPAFLKLRSIRAYNFPKETKTYQAWKVFEEKWSFGSFEP
jgi:ubiquinol-cytochrome c reductase cytochrome b subunit